MKQYQLHENYKEYTGLLNNVFPVVKGVVTIQDDNYTPKVLIEHYGAKLIQPKAPEEPKK